MAQQVFGKKLTDMSAERSTMAQQFPTVESLHPTEAMFDLLQEHASGYLRFALAALEGGSVVMDDDDNTFDVPDPEQVPEMPRVETQNIRAPTQVAINGRSSPSIASGGCLATLTESSCAGEDAEIDEALDPRGGAGAYRNVVGHGAIKKDLNAVDTNHQLVSIGLAAWAQGLDPDSVRAKVGMMFAGDGAPHYTFARFAAQHPEALGNVLAGPATEPPHAGHFGEWSRQVRQAEPEPEPAPEPE